MTKPAAFKATYSDFKLIKTRGVVQLCFEVPLSESDAAYQVVGGMPDPAAERWFAIAKLQTGAGTQPAPPPEPAPAREAEAEPPSASRPRLVASEKRLAQQAGICCNDPVFRLFLRERGHLAYGEEQAAATVRELCGVTSRAEIVPGTAAGDVWRGLHADFEAWRLVA